MSRIRPRASVPGSMERSQYDRMKGENRASASFATWDCRGWARWIAGCRARAHRGGPEKAAAGAADGGESGCEAGSDSLEPAETCAANGGNCQTRSEIYRRNCGNKGAGAG